MAFLETLVESCRLAIVLGKGGVGKTTISAALAMEAARRGLRVLLVTVRDANVMAHQLEVEIPVAEPAPILPHLDAVCLDPLDLASAHVKRFVPAGFIARRIVSSRIYNYFMNLAPAIKELLLMNRLRELEEEKDAAEKLRWDWIVLDGPPAGHGTVLLRIPRTTGVVVRAGPFRAMADRVQAMLSNRRRCRTLIVTVPEELPVNETLEVREQLAQRDLDIGLAGVIVNGVQPDPFPDPAVRRSYYALLERKDLLESPALRGICPLLQAVEERRSWRVVQERELYRLRRFVHEPLILVPTSPHLAIGREAIREIGLGIGAA